MKSRNLKAKVFIVMKNVYCFSELKNHLLFMSMGVIGWLPVCRERVCSLCEDDCLQGEVHPEKKKLHVAVSGGNWMVA